MQLKRRRMGTVYTRSPAQLAYKWAVDNTSKIIFSLIGCVIWMAVLYTFVGVVNFVGGNVAELWERDLPLEHLYNHPYLAPVKIIGAVLVFLYVFRDKNKH